MPRPNSNLLGKKFDLQKTFTEALSSGPPWESIVDFATHKSFCGKKLFPRQRTLLRLIYLETEHMTDYDLEVIGEWTQGWKNRNAPCGVQPDVWERIEYLKNHGYRHFPHIQAVMGRRASKGITGGILGAERMAYMYSLDDWQSHFGVDPHSVGELLVVATSLTQAARRQFADIRRTILNCEYLRPAVVANRYTEVAIRTPADERYLAELKAARIPIDMEIASLSARAESSTSTSGRGGAGFMNCLDPETPVLTADLRWVPIKRLCPGDEIVAVDDAPERGLRKVRRATVLSRWNTKKVAYRLTFDDGNSVVCSGDHRWLCQESSGSGNMRWRKVKESQERHGIKPGVQIVQMVSPWEEDDSREAGYLAGIYDGEGSVSNRSKKAMGTEVFISQNPGPVLDTTLQLLKQKGFSPMPCNSNAYLAEAERATQQWSLPGVGQVLRFLGQIRPERLLAKAHLAYEGGSLRGTGVRTVVSVEELPEQELVDISTSTGTFIANGLVSHNCYDEMAHMLMGTGSAKSGEEIYEAYQPSLRQFGIHRMTYIPSSPLTQIGKFYELYKQGSVLMNGQIVNDGQGGIDAEEELSRLVADPEMLVIQLPSWALYKDYDRSHTIPMRKPQLQRPGFARFGPKIPRPMQPDPEGTGPDSLALRREEQRNPEKFRVEYRAQFASVIDAYLDPAMVDAMFDPPEWREPLSPQSRGYLTRAYRIHADPSKSVANFAVCVAHTEDAPPDEHGDVWPCVIIDYLHVWRPEDFPADPETGKRSVDYVQINYELEQLLRKFPSTTKMTFDQYNSPGLISALKRKFSPRIRIGEVTFTKQVNHDRAEKFKSALNLGWIKSYRDTLFEDGQSLLETELKFLTDTNGRVDHQQFGPCTTKDLADAAMTVSVDLLHDALDLWSGRMSAAGAYGSSDVMALRSSATKAPTANQLTRGEHNRMALASMREKRSLGRGVAAAVPPTRGRWR